jgi:hypothetical protein
MVPLGASVLGRRPWLGESDLPELRCDSRLRGDLGRSELEPKEEPSEEPKLSLFLDLPLPNPLNADPRFDDDFRSGDDARPYG